MVRIVPAQHMHIKIITGECLHSNVSIQLSINVLFSPDSKLTYADLSCPVVGSIEAHPRR